ncbi:glycoside hydrolase family 76 protein [Crassisporium funariophilum]|nr:glycoside hydrolase family 76 protein [Crassisporium funariophilum]
MMLSMVKALVTILIGLTTLSASAASRIEKRQCQTTLNIAMGVAQRLQTHYFNSGNGQYTGGSLWTDANTLEDLHNLMLATGTNEFSSVADTSFIGKAALASNTNWQNILGGSNDDAGWIVLALWKIADYKANRGLANAAYLSSASKIYDIIAGQWDNTVCGGGVWWSTAHTYKNAVTNELFLLLSAQGFLRNGNQAYLANAQKTWNWLKNSGMRNSVGLWNDGLDSSTSTCKNNGQTTWTYNQGVIASGLAALSVATQDTSLLDQAEITLDATIALITQNNILRESCDNAFSGGSVCNQDQQIFKGIWTKHLQFYLDMANNAQRTAKYSSFLGSQTSAVFHYGTNAANDVGSVWYAPDQGGSIFTPKSSASGLAAHIAAAKYGPC